MGGRGVSSFGNAHHGNKRSEAHGTTSAEKAISDYTKEGYRKVRAYQTGKITDDGKGGEQARIIEDYIAKNGGLTGKTYRGIILESVPDFAVGGIINMRGTISWSTSQASAKEFGKPRLYGTYGVIFSSTGQKRGVDISNLSDAAHEHEVLVSEKSRYRVKKVSKKGSVYYVDLEEV